MTFYRFAFGFSCAACGLLGFLASGFLQMGATVPAAATGLGILLIACMAYGLSE